MTRALFARFICIQEDRSCLLCSLVDLERKELKILSGQRDEARKVNVSSSTECSPRVESI